MQLASRIHFQHSNDAALVAFGDLTSKLDGSIHPLLSVSFVPTDDGVKILDLDTCPNLPLLANAGSTYLARELGSFCAYHPDAPWRNAPPIDKHPLLGWKEIQAMPDESYGSGRGGLTYSVMLPEYSAVLKTLEPSRTPFGGPTMFFLRGDDRDLSCRRSKFGGYTERLVKKSSAKCFVSTNRRVRERPFYRPMSAESIDPSLEGQNAILVSVLGWKPGFEQYVPLGGVWIAAPWLNISLSCERATAGEFLLC